MATSSASLSSASSSSTPTTTAATVTTTTTANRLGSASPSTSVICEEIFDETCQPSTEEINEYALLLGIDPVKESHLLYLAKDGLMRALPADWKICYSEEKGGHYYYNIKTKQSQWDHPLDAVYRELVEKARQAQPQQLQHQEVQQQKTDSSTTAPPVVTPNIDNSEDISQMDSGIRSLQGNDDCDNTNNTNDMSSPISNINAHADGVIKKMSQQNIIISNNSIGNGSNSSTITTCTTSGFSGSVNRFLESRNKMMAHQTFQQVKNSRFEVAKTNLPLGMAIKIGAAPNGSQADTDGLKMKGGFTLSGTGAMFLKSRRQIEITRNEDIRSNVVIEGVVGTPPSVKGILRDSSLTDMRRRLERDNADADASSATSAESKKSVHFNLEDIQMLHASPENDPSIAIHVTQTPEISVNSDDDDDEDDDAENDDPWDDDEDDLDGVVDCMGIGSITVDGTEYQRSLNPFLVNDQQKEIKVIQVPKAQTIQMLRAQSLSVELSDQHSIPNEHKKISELSRSRSVEANTGHTAPASAGSVVSYLDNLKTSDSATVKPLYDDTDSESKGSSVRSFIINKSEQDTLHSTATVTTVAAPSPSNNPFDLDELGRKHSRDVEQLEMKLQSSGGGSEKLSGGLRSLKVASKFVNMLMKDSGAADKSSSELSTKLTQMQQNNDEDCAELKQRLEKKKQALLKEERERLEELLQKEIDVIKREHDQKLKNIRHEYDLRLTSHQHQMEEAMELQLEEIRTQMEEDLAVKRKAVVDEHKTRMTTLEKNHSEILQDLERDLKSAEEILKKEHAVQLNEMRDKLGHELEMEKQRMRDAGEDRLYEKLRCEKRLLEDKYRCVKEKYIRLKTDVRLSMERRNRRREAQGLQHQNQHTTTNTTTTTTTGSETERSISNKPSLGYSENRSLSLSTSCQDRQNVNIVNNSGGKSVKPPVPPKTHLATATANRKEHHTSRDRSTERSAQLQSSRKPGITSKYIKHLQKQDDTTTTSMSQSDTTLSNNYTKGHYLPAPVISDNGNSDSEVFQFNQENNNNAHAGSAINSQRKKVFSRMKSASTSRLNSDNNYKNDRPCTPVENLRHQLQKLEDLEDQFPDNTLDTTYHLRYPFTDISNDHPGVGGTSSELEFFKHRIHLERDSVRRAKESLRTQHTNFRTRQREIKQCHKASVTRHTLDQLIQEEKEITEMEVNLHRTRALLGEKVIRLRHLEQSLLRIYEKEKPSMDLLGVEHKDDAATLSDLSSHSSSGFSSTDFASGDTQNITQKRNDIYQHQPQQYQQHPLQSHQDSTECIQNLEILNAEISEILGILGKNQQQAQQQQHGGIPISMLSPSDFNWTQMICSSVGIPTGVQQRHTSTSSNDSTITTVHAQHSIPTLADRLENYRQLASGRMHHSHSAGFAPSGGGVGLAAANTIVSQSPRALNYTTSLVERTRDLRNWLRQAKKEHEILTTGGLTAPASPAPPSSLSHNTATVTVVGPLGVGILSSNSGNPSSGVTASIGVAGGGGTNGTQTNL